jgi:two-component system cell cycle response regulator DivK
VLVVDDDPISLLIITEMFRNEFEIYYALNSTVAMDLCSKITFDAIMIDVFLGDNEPSGTQLLQYLQKVNLNNKALFLAMSSSALPDEGERLKKMGFEHFFQKPIKKADVMNAIFV